MSQGVFLILLILISTHGFTQSKKSKYPNVKFAEVGESKADTLQFTGTVKSTYKCPPCPEGAQCKPCIGDHVLVTNGNGAQDFRVLTNTPDQLSQFEIGETYDFIVRFKSEFHSSHNIELVSAEKVR